MSSRKLITLLDGLPSDCWYKLSVERYLEELQDNTEREDVGVVGSLIFAQLTGQVIETPD